MRSFLATLALAFLTVIMVGLAAMHWIGGDLHRFFGVPPSKEGDLLYPNLPIQEAKRITLSGGGAKVSLIRKNGVWVGEEPWTDRADPRWVQALLQFTATTRVADVIPAEKIDDDKAGFNSGMYSIRIEDGERRPLAKYYLGRKTAFHWRDPETKELVSTLFIRPHDRSRKSHAYACTATIGEVHVLLRDGFRFFRDHRPLYFHPQNLAEIKITTPSGELSLSRETPESGWWIKKPMELRTDVGAMKKLLEGLYELTATKVTDASDVTLPTNGDAKGTTKITLKNFGDPQEISLTVYPPSDAAARTALATVTGRSSVFELPLKAEEGMVALSQLPGTVNDLRDKSLTNLNISALRNILIEPAGRTNILIRREPQPPSFVEIDGRTETVNERQLFELLKAVTTTKVSGYVTDAATDFTPYGLNLPLLRIHFLTADNQSLELRFGRGPDGTLYANRKGSPTVAKVDESLLTEIGIMPYQWKSPKLWNLDISNVMAVMRELPGHPKEELKCDLRFDDSWEAIRNGENATDWLNTNRATFLLNAIEKLEVVRWLGTAEASAATALAQPAISIKLAIKEVDEDDNFKGVSARELYLSPVSKNANNTFFYGRTNTDPNFFILDKKTVEELILPVFEDQE